MKKIKIFGKIIQGEEVVEFTGKGVYQIEFDQLQWKDDNKEEQYILDLKWNILSKDTQEINCVFHFIPNQTTPNNYTLKEYQQTVLISIYTKSIEQFAHRRVYHYDVEETQEQPKTIVFDLQWEEESN